MIPGLRIVTILLLASFPLTQTTSPVSVPEPDTDTAIVGTTLIDGSGSPPISDSVVIFQKGRILTVGRRGSVTIPPDARIVDGTGKWLIPGLIDMHVHLDEVITPEMFVRYGVTSVRDVGSRLVTMQKWRTKRARGDAIPHLYWMGRNIDEGKPSWWGAIAVKSAAEVPALLADMDRQGVDGVKLYVNSGPSVTKAVIQDAHLRGWPVTAHLQNTMPSQAAEMGIDNLEHVSQLFIELKSAKPNKGSGGFGSGFEGVPEVDLSGSKATHLIAVLAKHHVAVTPTLTVSLMPVLGEERASPYYDGWAPISQQWVNEWSRGYWSFLTPKGWNQKRYATAAKAYDKYREMVGTLYRARVPLIAGTDTPAPWVVPGAGLVVELQLMVQAGVPPLEAIHAATGRAAEVLHRSDDVGAILPGRIADMILLNADPLKDIRNLHKIDTVFMDGVRRR